MLGLLGTFLGNRLSSVVFRGFSQFIQADLLVGLVCSSKLTTLSPFQRP